MPIGRRDPQANSFEHSTLRELLEEQAVRRGDADFLILADSSERLSYAELFRRAVRVAQNLTAAGLTPGDKVCTLLDNSMGVAEIILGAMTGGFVPVPLNPISGSAHLESVVAHCEAKLVVATPDYRELLPTGSTRIASPREIVDVDIACREPHAARPAAPAGDADGLLIYTSGTTGRPRGALFSQAQVLRCAANTAHALDLSETDRLLCVLPLHHLNALEKLVTACLTGGSIVLADHFRVAEFWKLLIQHHCTWTTIVPTIVRQLVRHAESVPAPADLIHLRFVRSSSAPLPIADHLAFEERFGVVLAESMGMTEAGTLFHNPPTREGRVVGALGLPYGVEVNLVDADGVMVGCDKVGEIVVRGPSLMKGYYKDPAATAAAIDRDGWLHSGDRAYRNADGYYFHAGRIKELIIKGGVNIAPTEIDEIVAEHPDVVTGVATAVPDSYFGENVGLFAVKRAGSSLTEEALRQFCEDRLGLFKAPARVVFVNEIPRDASGKIQRYKLAGNSPIKATGTPRPASGAAPEAPRTTIERALVQLWTELLPQPVTDIHSDFASLGGTSLLALRILSRMRRQLGVDLPLALFFEAPTVAQQAAVIDSGPRARVETSQVLPILLSETDPECRVPPLFCAYGPYKYRALAKRLGPRQPVYGLFDELEPALLRPDLAAGGGDAATTVRELARRYAAQMRAIQPRGPYRLAGYSFGGLVAFEMAQQLHAEGEAVCLLALIDTYGPGSLRFRPSRWMAFHLRQSLRRGPSYVIKSARQRLRRSGIEVPRPGRREEVDLEARAWAFRRRARRHYVVHPYPGKVVLIRSLVHPGPAYDVEPLRGWKPLALGGLKVYDNPTGHFGTMWPENVHVIVDALRGELASCI